MTFDQPLLFKPNIRSEKPDATTGYIWGKPSAQSNILAMLSGAVRGELGIGEKDIVAERWLCTDDRGFPSQIETDGKLTGFDQLLEQFGQEIVGPQHMSEFGPYLGSIMKLLDTNKDPHKGSLSVQLHPKPGHPTRPSKPEMWQGAGTVYLGWNQDMTPEKIKAAIEASQLENYMNVIGLTPDKLVLVTGGLIHAIRYDSFLSEWSMSPGKDDIKKGNLKDATVAPYDRTDGKTPRPGKEDFEGSIEVMTNADTFGKSDQNQLLTQPITLSEDSNGKHLALFRTPIVFVDEYAISGEMPLSLTKRGKPLFVKQGSVTILHQGKPIADLTKGNECFLPFALKEVTLQARGNQPALVNIWYTPFNSEREEL